MLLSKCLISTVLTRSVWKYLQNWVHVVRLHTSINNSHHKVRAHALRTDKHCAHACTRPANGTRSTHMHTHTCTRNVFMFDSLLLLCSNYTYTRTHTPTKASNATSTIWCGIYLLIGSKIARLIYICDVLWLPEHMRSKHPEVPKKEKLTEAQRRKDILYIIPDNENVLMQPNDWIKSTFRY